MPAHRKEDLPDPDHPITPEESNRLAAAVFDSLLTQGVRMVGQYGGTAKVIAKDVAIEAVTIVVRTVASQDMRDDHVVDGEADDYLKYIIFKPVLNKVKSQQYRAEVRERRVKAKIILASDPTPGLAKQARAYFKPDEKKKKRRGRDGGGSQRT